MGPPAAGLAAGLATTIATDTTSVGQPQAGEGVWTYLDHHSSLLLYFLRKALIPDGTPENSWNQESEQSNATIVPQLEGARRVQSASSDMIGWSHMLDTARSY